MTFARFALSAAALFACAGAAVAQPLRLDYCVQAISANQFRYTFTLTMDNNNSSWVPGQGWAWLIFGDASGMSSPLADFVVDSPFPVGPWTSLSNSGGGHNGPTFAPVTDPWIPTAVGDNLTWSGTSARFLDAPDLLFSTLIPSGGAQPANFMPANRLDCNLPLGACCRPDGSCIVIDSDSCAILSGAFQGNGTICNVNCPQPPTGACCRIDGCAIVSEAICAATGGVYHGNNSTCGTANCPPAIGFFENPDAGDLPATAAVVSGSGSLETIRGSFAAFSDADMYKINICDPANFSADIQFGASGFGLSGIFLFHESGVGIANRWRFNGPATITNQFVASLPAGDYYLAVAPFLKMPRNSAGQQLWITNFDNIERAPDGPGAADPIDNWDAGGGSDGPYTINLTGACFTGGTAPCYANCDGSTTPPILNVADFGCFLSKFAAGDNYANCDGSTIPPVLNVADFGCFLTKFAAGCP